jgi:excisionase family DNA binding protein
VNHIPSDLIVPRQAARLVDVHVSAIYRWLRSGKLAGYTKAGSRYWVSRADVERMLQPVRPRPPLVPFWNRRG